jgi:hypothetical protein
MKLYKILSLGVLSLVFMFSILSCEKSASELDYGYEKIYIPQSLLTGSNVNYQIPAGLDSASRNYTLDKKTNKVNIILGVARSGTSDAQSFTVDIKNRADTVATILSKNTISNGVMLQETAYNLPAKVEVMQGKTEQTFWLSVDATMLKANYAGKKAVMAFELTNPTKYSLNQKNNKVVVIIDVNALNIP